MSQSPLASHPFWRQFVIVAIAVPVVVAAVVLSFAWPAARVAPRDLPVGLVAGTGSAQVAAGLERTAPGGFDLRLYPDADTARRAIAEREVYGALAVRGDTVTVYEASAGSLPVAQALGEAGTGLATASGGQVRTVDVVPLSGDDPRGAVLTSAVFPLILGSLLIGAAVALLLSTVRLWRRLAALVVVSAVAALGVLLLAQGFLGALPGNNLATWAGLGLGMLAISSTAAGAVALLGPAGLGLAAPILVFVGNGFSGATSAPEMLPGAVRAIGQVLPPGAVLSLIRGTAYFDGHGVAGPIVVLSCWTVVGLVTVAAGHWRLHRSSAGDEPVDEPADSADAAPADEPPPRHALRVAAG